jgi:arsenite methyltransferase
VRVGDLLVDPGALRLQVREKYRAVATEPGATYHFHTGRPLARRLGYDAAMVDSLPEQAVESFAGLANPFSLRPLQPGERVVDIGSGAGFDSFVAAAQVGGAGRVVGVDMTPEMLKKASRTAELLGLSNVEFRDGLAEALPVEDQWADVVISNGVINLCPTSGPCSPRSAGCCDPAAGWPSLTSPTAAPCRLRRCATLTCGPVELPAGCPVPGGRGCSKRLGSSTSRSAVRRTHSPEPAVRRRPMPSRSTATPSRRGKPGD